MSLRTNFGHTAVALLISFAFVTPLAKADGLSIAYISSQNQTATVGSAFTTVVFDGFIVNNTTAAITFQLTGGPVPFEPFVASFVNGIGYPGITLAGGQSTDMFALATVKINPFDLSLTYPGLVNIELDAISVDPVTGHTGGIITENDATILVGVPEPSTLLLLTLSLLVVSLKALRFRLSCLP